MPSYAHRPEVTWVGGEAVGRASKALDESAFVEPFAALVNINGLDEIIA